MAAGDEKARDAAFYFEMAKAITGQADALKKLAELAEKQTALLEQIAGDVQFIAEDLEAREEADEAEEKTPAPGAKSATDMLREFNEAASAPPSNVTPISK